MSSFPMPDARFEKLLESENIAREKRGDYLKWVRFYLHFCGKCGHDAGDNRSLPLFLEKLKSKGQTEEQRDCARNAVELYRSLEVVLRK